MKVIALLLIILYVQLELSNVVECKKKKKKRKGFPAKNFKLLKQLSPFALGWTKGSHCSDLWGYKDDRSGKNYAIINCEEGSSLVDISEPSAPSVVGKIWGHNRGKYIWRDVKVYKHYAFFVSEAYQSELQVLDLNAAIDGNDFEARRLLNEDYHRILRGAKKNKKINKKVQAMGETTVYEGGNTRKASNAHNIIINEDSGFAYLVGGSTGCYGGLHIVNIKDPLNPKFTGCWYSPSDTYIHDAQCVTYKTGVYAGKNVCFAFSPYVVMTVDVTNHANPSLMDKFHYDSTGYVHQGWLTTDKKFLLVDDELDNKQSVEGYRTFVLDVRDLNNLKLAHIHVAKGKTFGDHNQYVMNINGGDIDYTYQANYAGGLRALRIKRDANKVLGLEEVGFFDTFKDSNSLAFNGAWSAYPYFDPIHLVSDQKYGLFILERQFDDNTPALPVGSPTPQPTTWVNCKNMNNKADCNSKPNNCVWDYDWIQARGWKPECYYLPGSIKPQKDSNGNYRGPVGGNCGKLSKTQCSMYPSCWFNQNKCKSAPF